jgi:hypothetical protein
MMVMMRMMMLMMLILILGCCTGRSMFELTALVAAAELLSSA